MSIPVSVSLSGPAFSFLLYENTKSCFQQEGFLLGEIIHKESRTITDSDQHHINITKTIKINSVVPCPQNHYFYNGSGKVDTNKVKDLLGNQVNKVVAWYKFQRINNFKFTLRDKLIHKQLTDFFSILPEYFTCGLLTNETSENRSTHIFSQSFIRYHNTVYDKLPVHIPNLSEPNNTYKNSEPASETFSKILSHLKIDRENTPSLVVINRIETALQNHIDSVVEKLAAAEQQLYELEDDVRQLEIIKKLKKKNDEDMEAVENKKKKEDVELMDVTIDTVCSNQNENSKTMENKSENDCISKESLPEVIKTSPAKRGRGRGRSRSRGRLSREVKDLQ